MYAEQELISRCKNVEYWCQELKLPALWNLDNIHKKMLPSYLQQENTPLKKGAIDKKEFLEVKNNDKYRYEKDKRMEPCCKQCQWFEEQN